MKNLVYENDVKIDISFCSSCRKEAVASDAAG